MNVSVSNFNNQKCSSPNLLSEKEISRFNSLGINLDDDFSHYANRDDIPVVKSSDLVNEFLIIAYRVFIERFVTKCLKKRSRVLIVLLNQLLFLQSKVPDIKAYLDEERNNLVNFNDDSKRSYNHGFITGYMLKDYANTASTIEGTVSKTFTYLENKGYLTKISISTRDDYANNVNNEQAYGYSEYVDGNGEVKKVYNHKHYKRERIQVRLNLINIFKDIILFGFVSLDAGNNSALPREFHEIYQDVRLILKYSQLAEYSETIGSTEADTTDNQQETNYNMVDLVNIYSNQKGVKLTDSQLSQIVDHLNQIRKADPTRYSLTQLAIAIDNYELFRNITNRHGKYMKSPINFFTTPSIIDDFLDINFQSILQHEISADNSDNPRKTSKYKSLDVASQAQISRKLQEKNEAQRKFDMYVELCRKSLSSDVAKTTDDVNDVTINSNNNNDKATTCSTIDVAKSSTASLLSNCKYDVSNQINEEITDEVIDKIVDETIDKNTGEVIIMRIDVNELIKKQSTRKAIMVYYKKCNYQNKLDYEDVLNEAYLIATELLADTGKVYSGESSFLKAVIYKLRDKYYRIYGSNTQETANTVSFSDGVYSNDDNLFLQTTESCENYYSWSFDDLFNSEYSVEKIIYQLLFCLATNDEVVKDVPFAHNRLLNGYLFCKGSEEHKINELTASFGYTDKSSVYRLLKQFFTNIDFIVKDYCKANGRLLTELVSTDDLVQCDDDCELLTQSGTTLSLRVDDLFEYDCYVDASQLSDVSALRDRESGLVKLVEYVAFRLASVKVNASLNKRVL